MIKRRYIGKVLHPGVWKKAKKAGEKLKAKAGRGLPLALHLLFVGIPLPGTTRMDQHALAAIILDMDF